MRGLLCFKCNNALGDFADDVAQLDRAITYLITHDPEQVELGAITQRRLAALAS